MFPALQEASRDAALTGSPHSVYLWLSCNLLDFGRWQPIKIQGLARAARLGQPTTGKAVRTLVARGYLSRRYVARTGYEYLLLFNRRA